MEISLITKGLKGEKKTRQKRGEGVLWMSKRKRIKNPKVLIFIHRSGLKEEEEDEDRSNFAQKMKTARRAGGGGVYPN